MQTIMATVRFMSIVILMILLGEHRALAQGLTIEDLQTRYEGVLAEEGVIRQYDSLYRSQKVNELGDIESRVVSYALGISRSNPIVYYRASCDLVPIDDFRHSYFDYSELLWTWFFTSDTFFARERLHMMLLQRRATLDSSLSKCRRLISEWKNEDEFLSVQFTEMFDVMSYLCNLIDEASLEMGLARKEDQ